MTVATPVQPDYTQNGTQYPINIDAAFAAAWRAAMAFAPHEQASPNMTVRIDAGFLFDGAARTEVAAQSTATITAPASNPRKDLVYIDKGTGAVGVATGTEAASPAEPDCPAGKLPVAIVALATSTTQITNSLLTDVRAVWSAGLGAAAFLAIGAAANQIATNAMLGAAAHRGVHDSRDATNATAQDAGKLVELDSAGKLPSYDGSQLRNVPMGDWLFTSSEQTFTAGTGYKIQIAHGLGRKPYDARLILRCKTADSGYAVGDELLIGSGVFVRSYGGVIIESGDTTYVYVMLDTASPHFSAPSKTGSHAFGDLTDASWALVVQCR